MLGELVELAEKLEPDARRVLVNIAKRAVTGAEEHGRLDLDNDPRDWIKERRDELFDALFYTAAAELSQPASVWRGPDIFPMSGMTVVAVVEGSLVAGVCKKTNDGDALLACDSGRVHQWDTLEGWATAYNVLRVIRPKGDRK